MAITERAVKCHLTRLFEIFGVAGRMELARASLKNVEGHHGVMPVSTKVLFPAAK